MCKTQIKQHTVKWKNFTKFEVHNFEIWPNLRNFSIWEMFSPKQYKADFEQNHEIFFNFE